MEEQVKVKMIPFKWYKGAKTDATAGELLKIPTVPLYANPAHIAMLVPGVTRGATEVAMVDGRSFLVQGHTQSVAACIAEIIPTLMEGIVEIIREDGTRHFLKYSVEGFTSDARIFITP